MTLDLTKPVQTRGGQTVRILATDIKGAYRVAGTIEGPDEHGVETWTIEGKFYPSGGGESCFDLMNVPEPNYHSHAVAPGDPGFDPIATPVRSLRDDIAIEAMKAILGPDTDKLTPGDRQWAAEESYALADAMMKARAA